MDRFTFEGSSAAFVELDSEEQVQKAVKALDGLNISKRPLRVSRLADTFEWDAENRMRTQYFVYDTAAASQAIQPLLEGRRYTVFVEKPGWISERKLAKSAMQQRREILDRMFQSFNVEAMGGINPAWKFGKSVEMIWVTFVDFRTKEDAQRALDALNNSVVEGKRVELRQYSTVYPRRAEQIGKVDKGVLTQLQEAGFVKGNAGNSNS